MFTLSVILVLGLSSICIAMVGNEANRNITDIVFMILFHLVGAAGFAALCVIQ
ncbi:TMhelix containing protein [Vibrio phage 1.102.O._10N.261.45.E3]|uniref:TMhelix containing protein n=5 Tax=unclassified Autolykiviridae TaxID=2788751 RepID=A0A2I7R1X8_9VIRU|nr:TMhelix containing protein [Vibrio phage 1.048.O._10N.286.46.A10]AUR87639.1 TMhelix containing protein [Vibrio phage 1.102.O._10N.261.45.E3]AUR88004.1 TMhelix containing protein [Vibrio phage 1.107.A._10N.286.52.E10]AUR88026.1 TMhelix containing protein [Vibrio phage 1.107.B._10N.286.52.E10]AUR88048.1 TMhelix containing protein [Vibrio phage 1.107.C._10N.286.52.E10]